MALAQTVLRTSHPFVKPFIALSSEFSAGRSFFPMSTISAELHKKHFSFGKVLNRSVDNSVQKPASPIPNFPYSNKLMRFAQFQGTSAKLVSSLALSTIFSDGPDVFL